MKVSKNSVVLGVRGRQTGWEEDLEQEIVFTYSQRWKTTKI